MEVDLPPPPWVLKGLKYAGSNRVNNDCMMIDNLLELSKAASSIRFQIRETPTSELILGTLTIDDHEAVDKSDDVDDDDGDKECDDEDGDDGPSNNFTNQF